MVYFRLQLSLPVDVSFKTHRNETCKDVSWRKRLVPEEEERSTVGMCEPRCLAL